VAWPPKLLRPPSIRGPRGNEAGHRHQESQPTPAGEGAGDCMCASTTPAMQAWRDDSRVSCTSICVDCSTPACPLQAACTARLLSWTEPFGYLLAIYMYDRIHVQAIILPSEPLRVSSLLTSALKQLLGECIIHDMCCTCIMHATYLPYQYMDAPTCFTVATRWLMQFRNVETRTMN